MRTQSVLLSGVALGALIALSCGASADAATKKHHKAAPAASSTEAEIQDLEANVQFLTDRLDEQAAVSRDALAQLKIAQDSAAQAKAAAATAVATANADDATIKTLPTEVKKEVAADAPKPNWASNTTLGATLYTDFSNISQTPTPNKVNGTGADIKRAYISVDHTFNSIYSANLTVDLAPNGIILNGGTFGTGTNQGSEVVKYAYVQAKYFNELVVQAGEQKNPWIPFVEDIYGYRFVDKVIADQNKFGSSADFGLNAHGDIAKGLVQYSVSVEDGAGYKNPVRSKTVDVEGRVNVNYMGFVAAVGGYSGQLSSNIQTVPATAFQTATREDALLAYTNSKLRLGIEYLQETDWKVVTKTTPDKSQGYSAFGSYMFMPQWSVFGRYDALTPSQTLASAERYTLANVGISYEPVKTVDLALVYKRETIAHAPTGGYTDGTTTLAPAGGAGTYSEFGLYSQVKF
jgi:hypothetical protein